MDPVTLATGAGLLLSGGVLDRLIRPRKHQRKAVCGCEHHLALHADGGIGPCQYLDVIQDLRDEPMLDPKNQVITKSGSGNVRTHEVTVIVDKIPCPCTGYVAKYSPTG